MKERSIKSIRHRVMSRLKGLGAMLLALFVALAAIPFMPAMEALAESASGEYWLVEGAGTRASGGLYYGTESIEGKKVYDQLEGRYDNCSNSYIKFGNGEDVAENSPLTLIGDFIAVYNGVDFEVPKDTTFNLGVAKYDTDICKINVSYNETSYATQNVGNDNKKSFEISKGKYNLKIVDFYEHSYKLVKTGEVGGDDTCSHDIQLFAAQEPTCTEDGYEEHYECTKCHKWFGDAAGQLELDDSEIARRKKKATGHKWNKGEVIQEATYDETGIKLYTCSRCGETREETIPKKTRSYDSDSSDSGDGGGSGGGRGGTVSTQSLDVNGNAIGGPDPNRQPDSGAPVSDRGGNWGNENLSWTYTKSDGNLAKSEWLNLEYNGHTYWYYFDDGAIMQTDWFNYNGATYYFVPEMDGWRGRMVTGWQQIGDKWYYFEPTVGQYQGQMYRGIMTPDGHMVGADGAWNGVGTPPVSTAATA